jgi:uncharacterized spore protein YtfJ
MARVGSMTIEEISQSVRDGMDVKRVFGEPIERDGVTIIPVASIGGGGGGGGGGTEAEGGSGGGFGMAAKPIGVYVIKNGEVAWRPTVDVNKIIGGIQLAVVLVLLTVRRIVKRRSKKR